MFKKLIVLISILFSFYSYCQTDIKIILEAGSDNVSVKINWDINALITPITLNIHMMDNTSSVYSLVKSIQNPTNNSSTTIDLQLADDTFFITADFTDNYGNSYYSDTLSPIYIILGGGGITQPHPTIRCPKYQLESPDTLYLYRKYPHEADFNRINPKVESGTSFEDNTLIGVCNEEIGYQVINKANNSFSAQKFSQYTDANPPDKPIIRGLTVENNNLSIQWNHSLDTDVEYYKIDTMIPKYGTWITKATVSVNENVYTLVNDFCSQQSDFTVQYRILAVDLCGNSTVWDIEEKAYNPLILNTPYIHECNYVRFSWNNANCLNGDISKYFIVINNIELQTTDTIFVNNNNIITENNENVYFVKINEFQSSTTYNCQLYAVNEAQPPDTVRTCTSEFFIDKAPNSPDTLSIIGIRYNPATSSNTIDIIVDPNPDEGVEYILYTSPRTNSDGITKSDTITIISADKFPLSSNRLQVEDFMHIDAPYTYHLIAKNDCNTSFVDSTSMQSIYLMGNENENEEMFRLCFSQNLINYDYDTIIYKVIKSYITANSDGANDIELSFVNCNTNVVGSSEFISYCEINSPKEIYNYCDYDMDFFYGDESYSISWYIEAEIIHSNGNISYSISNPVALQSNIRMPNAFIPNAINEINRRFGPINISPQSSSNIQSIDFQIFNSWGERIWHGTDILNDFYWNGYTRQGREAPAGVYIYIHTITFNNGMNFQTKGSVNLIRH